MLPAIALFTPLIGAIAILLTGKKPNVREGSTLFTSGILFVMVASMIGPILNGKTLNVTLFQLTPELPIAFEVEPLGLIYALVASFLWIFNSLYSIGYMRTLYGAESEGQTRYYTCFAVAIFAALGIAFSGNLLTLFFFYEVLTFSTYPLVTHARNDKAFRSGRIYLGILVGTSTLFFLAAVVWTWILTDNLTFSPGGVFENGDATAGQLAVLTCLFFFGCGKTALMPFHMWLPNAMVAPTPVSALLHAVAVVKAGVFTVLKIAIGILGLKVLEDNNGARVVAWFAAFTIIVASLFAMAKDNLKARLAYSTIGQLSYIVLAAALATEAAWTGGGMHIAMHAFGKITLFFCAGAIYVTARKTNVSELSGIGRKMPITMLCFLVGALSTIGLPPFGGAWSKWFIAQGALGTAATFENVAFLIVLLVSSLLNIAYLLPIPLIAFFGKSKEAAEGEKPDANANHGEAPLLCRIPIIVTAAGCLVLFVWPNMLQNLAAMATGK